MEKQNKVKMGFACVCLCVRKKRYADTISV